MLLPLVVFSLLNFVVVMTSLRATYWAVSSVAIFHTRSGFQRLGRAHDPHLCLDHHLRDDGAVVGQEGLQLGFTKCYAGLSYDDVDNRN
jgi:hypothetical protein